MKKIKLLFVITGLNQGGAETMLYKLLLNIDRNKFDLYIISLIEEGVFGKKIKDMALPIYFLNIQKTKLFFLLAIIKYSRLVKKIKPDIIQGWMYHGNLFAMLGKLLCWPSKIIFNIRQSIQGNSDKYLTRIIIKLNAWASKYVMAVINNSQESQQQHADIGFSKKNPIYIPNGFDVDLFKPDLNIYRAIRDSFGLDQHAKIVGNLGRFHPIKNHLAMLTVFQKIKLAATQPVIFILAGTDIDLNNQKLRDKIYELGLQDCCYLLGEIEAHTVMPAFDVYISTSLSEGFPNVIGEALACGVPCVATDVGDCKLIINKFGDTVPLGDYDNLAKQAIQWLDTNEDIKKQMREYIIANYSIVSIVKKYEDLYLKVLNLQG